MAQQAFNFQALVRRLGLKNVDELPIVQAIQPVILAGDGSELSSTLRTNSAWWGREEPAVVGENFAFQMRAIGRGGLIIDIWASSPVDTQWGFRIDQDGGDPLAADPLGFQNLQIGVQQEGPEDILVSINQGTTTVAPGSFQPTIDSVARRAVRIGPIFIQTAAQLTFSNDDFNTFANVTVHIREVASANLTPEG